MKPFDLKAAKRGETIVTRDGREAQFIAHVPEARPSYSTVVLIDGETFSIWDSGYYYWEGTRESPNDLFMAPKKRTVWVNLYHVFTPKKMLMPLTLFQIIIASAARLTQSRWKNE